MQRGMTGATANVYFGLADYQEMALLLHLLRPGDLFVDVGANVGVYTVLACAVCGADAMAVEPIPETFRWLTLNIAINQIANKTVLLNIGLGREEGCRPFTTALGPGNRMLDGSSRTPDAVDVSVRRLDSVVNGAQPLAIKVDAEGSDSEILASGPDTLQRESLKCIIVELWRDGLLHRRLCDLGFRACAYDPVQRQLAELDQPPNATNAIYLRDIAFVRQRVRDASHFNVLGQSL